MLDAEPCAFAEAEEREPLQPEEAVGGEGGGGGGEGPGALLGHELVLERGTGHRLLEAVGVAGEQGPDGGGAVGVGLGVELDEAGEERFDRTAIGRGSGKELECAGPEELVLVLACLLVAGIPGDGGDGASTLEVTRGEGGKEGDVPAMFG